MGGSGRGVFCSSHRDTKLSFPEARPFLRAPFGILCCLWRCFQIMWTAYAYPSAMPACFLHSFTQLSDSSALSVLSLQPIFVENDEGNVLSPQIICEVLHLT